MCKRIFILLGAFMALHFIVYFSENARFSASCIEYGQGDGRADNNIYSYADRLQHEDVILDVAGSHVIKKHKPRTRIWTKMFPFLLPEQAVISFSKIFSEEPGLSGQLSSRYCSQLLISSLRGPPAFS